MTVPDIAAFGVAALLVAGPTLMTDVPSSVRQAVDGLPGIIELPVIAKYGDWMHGLSALFSPRSVFSRKMSCRSGMTSWTRRATGARL